MTNIGEYAFEYCYKLVEVYNLSKLEITKGSSYNGYVGCYALDIYTSKESASKLHMVNDYIFYEYGETVYLMAYSGNETELVLPDKYNNKNYSIYQYTFYNCRKLTSITIGNGVTSIGEDAFMYCSGLTSIIIGNGVTSIGEWAFYYCSKLTRITIPSGVTSIGIYAFAHCISLESITISSSVRSIAYAFYDCNSLTSVYYNGTSTEWQNTNGYSSLTLATVYYYSENKPTEDGNYWHYDEDGVTPVIWG